MCMCVTSVMQCVPVCFALAACGVVGCDVVWCGVVWCDVWWFSHGFFSLSADGKVRSRQRGVMRTNCVDNLDRTNVVQV
jgi:hypothetical protein